MTYRHLIQCVAAATVMATATSGLRADDQQRPPAGQRSGGAPGTSPTVPATPAMPPDYTIGLGDVLFISTFQEKELSGDFVVRPDGKFSMPQLGEFRALGLTPVQLAALLGETAKKSGLYDIVPNITVTVKEIRSRKVSITGQVNKGGEFDLFEPMNIAQLISKAGGLTEFAKKKDILVIHAQKRPDGSPWTTVVNYDDILRRRNLEKNLIDMRPGDVVIVK